jgi:hopanoid biosynthesis associated protein HpnK
LKQLIVSADDFGYTRGVNRGIVAACTDGIVTSASLLANGAAFEDAVEQSRQAPGLDVGCHVNLVEGRPVSRPEHIPRLVGSGGNFLGLRALGLRLLAGAVSLVELERECTAQVERLLAAGISPTHLDTHQHTHLHPRVALALSRTARRYGVPWIRRLPENVTSPIREGTWRRKAIGVAAYLFASRFDRRLSMHGLRAPDFFTGFSLTGRLTRSALEATLVALPEGITELMCHPGYCDLELEAAPTRLRRERAMELETLADPVWHTWLRERGIVLTNFAHLARAQAPAGHAVLAVPAPAAVGSNFREGI